MGSSLDPSGEYDEQTLVEKSFNPQLPCIADCACSVNEYPADNCDAEDGDIFSVSLQGSALGIKQKLAPEAVRVDRVTKNVLKVFG